MTPPFTTTASRLPRPFSLALGLAAILLSPLLQAAIDRHAVVSRHAVHVRSLDPESPLSVGNGDFAFTVDATGLQSFEDLYHKEGIPLETLSSWAWDSFPNPKGLKLEDASIPYSFHGRTIRYAGLQDSPAGSYFRQNPHPVPLGQLGLLLRGKPLKPSDISKIDQSLDLWTGLIRSSYLLEGQPVVMETAAHPRESLVTVRLHSPLLAKGELGLRLRFASSYNLDAKNKPPLVWNKPDAHTTHFVSRAPGLAVFKRGLSASSHVVSLRYSDKARITETAAHEYLIGTDEGELELSCSFSPKGENTPPPEFETVARASADGWRDYWEKGAAVDFSGSKDPRAFELERRIVLSRYLLKVNYAGAFPPAESGLTHLSWYGKHNSEMYFWHAAQFYQWGHPELLERGLDWYRSILPQGKAEAAAQGFEGVRWPKMVGPDGQPSPGTINPFIIWNQPNPIYLAELLYRASPTRETLEKNRDLVFESAKFLASFAHLDPASGRYVLGPPIKNVSEKAGENTTMNPTFELAYWHYGLKVAQTWRQRLGLEPDRKWADIMTRLSRLPVSGGRYLEIETETDVYEQGQKMPVSMTLALGFLPKTEMVDADTMRRTFATINQRSPAGLKRWVSWSVGQGAMTAARLGDPKTAVEILLNDNPAARFLPNGHVRRAKEPEDCPAYLPVNGAFLAAAGLMIAGWDDAPPGETPGFPQDGSWSIRWEGLNRMP